MMETTSAADGASGATDAAKEKASEAAGQAREKAQEAAGQAKGRVREQVDQRSTQAGQQVASTSNDLRSVGEELRKQGKDTPAKLADQAADRAQRVGSYLEESDADRILNDIEDFGRRQPWAVVAGGLALGFVASRFLKASSSERYRASQPGYDAYRDGAGYPTVEPPATTVEPPATTGVGGIEGTPGETRPAGLAGAPTSPAGGL